MKVALVNDTGSKLHVGCQLVAQAFREQCELNGIEIVFRVPYNDFDLTPYYPQFEKVDLLLINGEGTIHHGRRPDLLALADHFPAALVNCVYESNPPSPSISRFVYIAARESLSAKAIEMHGGLAEIVPDVALLASDLVNFRIRRQPLDLGITDNVVSPWCGFPISHERLSPLIYLENLSLYRRLCIGRFHALIVAASLGIPFSTWPSNTWKIDGLMQDLGVSSHHHPTFEEAYLNAPICLNDSVLEYVLRGRKKIANMFKHLSKL